MNQVKVLRMKVNRQKQAYVKNRVLYPEIARLNKLNVKALIKQIRILQSQGEM